MPGPRRGERRADVAKEGGAHWLWSVWQYLIGAQLEFNDLGYLERKNDYQALLRRSRTGTLKPWWHTLETRHAR